MQRSDSLEKILMLGKIEGRKRMGLTEGEMVGRYHLAGPGLDVFTAAFPGSYQGFHQLGESSLKKKVIVQSFSHV